MARLLEESNKSPPDLRAVLKEMLRLTSSTASPAIKVGMNRRLDHKDVVLKIGEIRTISAII
jgi:hypothetical protein